MGLVIGIALFCCVLMLTVKVRDTKRKTEGKTCKECYYSDIVFAVAIFMWLITFLLLFMPQLEKFFGPYDGEEILYILTVVFGVLAIYLTMNCLVRIKIYSNKIIYRNALGISKSFPIDEIEKAVIGPKWIKLFKSGKCIIRIDELMTGQEHIIDMLVEHEIPIER